MNNARYMRATVAAWLVAVSALAADPLVVEFSLVNLGVQPATNRSVIITPIILEPGPGQVAVYDRVLRNTGLSGKFYLTNLMVGMYRVTVQTPPDTTTYAIAVTTNDVGRVSADKMLVAMPTAVVRPQDYPYSAQASDRRYAPASVSTTATGWKLVEPEYAGGTNTFAPVYQLTQGNGIVVNPVTTAVGSGLYTVKTQWMELDREIVVWTNAAGDLITRSPHDEVDDIYVFTSQAGATNFDATTGWPGWGIGWQGLTNSGVLAAKWSWTTNYTFGGWGVNGQTPTDGAVLAFGDGLDYTTNGAIWTIFATNIPAPSLGTTNPPAADKVLTLDSNTNLYWGEGGGGTGQTEWPFTAITNAPWAVTNDYVLNVQTNLFLKGNLILTNSNNTSGYGNLLITNASAPGGGGQWISFGGSYLMNIGQDDIGIFKLYNDLTLVSDGEIISGYGFTGNGENLTNLNASTLSDGTVPLARLSGITSNQIADSTLGTNKLDANAYALLMQTGGGSGTATNLAPGLNATNLTWGAGLDYTTNGGVWTVYATNIPARSLGTSNAPAAGKVLTVDAGTNLYWGEGGGGSVNAENIVWPFEPLAPLDWNFTSITNVSYLALNELVSSSIISRGGGFIALEGLMYASNGIVSSEDISIESPAQFKGNGGGLTNLNASALSDGTVPLARLSGITSNQIADSTLGTNKLDANAYALLTKTGGGSGTATNLAPGLNATNLTLVKGTNTLAGTDTGWSFTGKLAGDGSGLSNVPIPPNSILTNATLVQYGSFAGASSILVTNGMVLGRANSNETVLYFSPSPSNYRSWIIFRQQSPAYSAGLLFWPNRTAGKPDLMFFNEGTVTFDGVLRWGELGHYTLNYETWQYMRNGGWIDRQSGTTNFLLWPGPVWQFESRLRTNTGPNDIVWAGSVAPLNVAKKPSLMFRPTSENGSAAWIFADDFDATKQSTVSGVDTLWGKNNHTIYTDNTYTERLRITAGPDGGLSFNGRFIVNGKEGLTTNVLAGETRLDITNGVIVGVTLNEVLQLTPRTITNSNASTWGKGAGLICVDANYIYISTGTNTWKRATLEAW